MSSPNLCVTYVMGRIDDVTPTVTAEGLRARKKRETREAISASATALFARRGFDSTTISDVAREAGVSKMTVTNYFALKEDLVFDRRAEIVARLAGAVRDRGDRSVLQALHDVLEQGLRERNPTFGFIGPRFAEMVLASPALLASERSMSDAQEQALASALSSGPGDVEAELAAAALA